jgi:hypothetical protein
MTSIEKLGQRFSTSALLKFGVKNFLSVDIALYVKCLTTWMFSKIYMSELKSCPVLLQWKLCRHCQRSVEMDSSVIWVEQQITQHCLHQPKGKDLNGWEFGEYLVTKRTWRSSWRWWRTICAIDIITLQLIAPCTKLCSKKSCIKNNTVESVMW